MYKFKNRLIRTKLFYHNNNTYKIQCIDVGTGYQIIIYKDNEEIKDILTNPIDYYVDEKLTIRVSMYFIDHIMEEYKNLVLKKVK